VGVLSAVSFRTIKKEKWMSIGKGWRGVGSKLTKIEKEDGGKTGVKGRTLGKWHSHKGFFTRLKEEIKSPIKGRGRARGKKKL